MTVTDRSDKQLVFTIHALEESSVPGAPVPARAFNAKCRAVLWALEGADTAVAPPARHVYYITKLTTGSSAVVGITERLANPAFSPSTSAIDSFLHCADAIYRGRFDEARRYNGLARRVFSVVKDAGEKFAYIDFVADGAPSVRGDDFLRDQTKRFLEAKEEIAEAKDAVFSGQSYESFDGEIKLVDLLGDKPRGVLRLSGTGVEIKCTFKGLSRDEIRDCLDRRVWAEGFAIYTGKSPLPQRLEITKATAVKSGGDIMAWRGVVSPVDELDWESPFDQSH